MFQSFRSVLGAQLDDGETLTFNGIDAVRVSSVGHVVTAGTDRFTSPDDFTLDVDGSGTGTLTWDSATPVPTGTTLWLHVALIDSLTGAVGGGGAGGGTGDASEATLQDILDVLNALNNDTSTATVMEDGYLYAKVVASAADAPVGAAGDTLKVVILEPGDGAAAGDVVIEDGAVSYTIKAARIDAGQLIWPFNLKAVTGWTITLPADVGALVGYQAAP